MARNFPPVPESFGPNTAEWIRTLAFAINAMLLGRSNNTGSVTLTAGATSTTVSDRRVHAESVIHHMPTTATAGGSISMYVSSVGKQTFTITHAEQASTTRVFKYSIHG